MKIDWKVAVAAAIGVVIAFVAVKALVGYLPSSVQGYVPSALKS